MSSPVPSLAVVSAKAAAPPILTKNLPLPSPLRVPFWGTSAKGAAVTFAEALFSPAAAADSAATHQFLKEVAIYLMNRLLSALTYSDPRQDSLGLSVKMSR